jgi:diphthamide biosynthesis methyltransferase
MLYIIGLGLSDEKDITIKGLEAINSCERIYLEAYTSILMVPKEKLVISFFFLFILFYFIFDIYIF